MLLGKICMHVCVYTCVDMYTHTHTHTHTHFTYIIISNWKQFIPVDSIYFTKEKKRFRVLKWLAWSHPINECLMSLWDSNPVQLAPEWSFLHYPAALSPTICILWSSLYESWDKKAKHCLVQPQMRSCIPGNSNYSPLCACLQKQCKYWFWGYKQILARRQLHKYGLY